MKSPWGLAFGVLIGLLAAGGLFLLARPPGGEPVKLLPAPSPAPLLVHVTGAVFQPGVYALPPGSRLQDALQAAGGALESADVQALNLAAALVDGQRLAVPQLAPTPLAVEPGSLPELPERSTGVEIPLPSPTPGLVDINTADLAALDTLPGIGPVIAQRIIDYRLAHGAFQTAEDLLDVSGIGPATLEKILPLITVSPPP